MPRCDFCFKDKAQLMPVLPKCPAKVCKGCFYEIDRVVGFLEHYGISVIHQTAFSVDKATKSKSRGIKREKGTEPLASG